MTRIMRPSVSGDTSLSLGTRRAGLNGERAVPLSEAEEMDMSEPEYEPAEAFCACVSEYSSIFLMARVAAMSTGFR